MAEHPFDTLARTLAGRSSRRSALRPLSAALAPGLAAAARRAWPVPAARSARTVLARRRAGRGIARTAAATRTVCARQEIPMPSAALVGECARSVERGCIAALGTCALLALTNQS